MVRTQINRIPASKGSSVEAVMLNSTTPKHEIDQTYERLMNPPANGEDGIKLLYVTVSPNPLVEIRLFSPFLARKDKTKCAIYAISA